MSNLLLTIISYAVFIFAFPYFLYRLFTGRETAESMWEKFGFYIGDAPQEKTIWLHAVSVGEVNTALPLLKLLMTKFPDKKFIFSVSTKTGMALAKEKVGDSVRLTFFPYDFPFAVLSALSFFNPSLFIFMETELWPNFLSACHRRGIKTIMINGRISDKSFRNYKKIKFFSSPLLKNLSALLMQSDNDANRIMELGADEKKVKVTGNLKFDRPLPTKIDTKKIKTEFDVPIDKDVIIFASAHPGEEDIFISAYKNLKADFKNLFAVIAPRHPDKGAMMAERCKDLSVKPALRSRSEKPSELLILDTIGEMGRLYGACEIAVIGGSFIPHGGQNPLEPAGWKLPLLYGKYMHNFRDITRILEEAGGAIKVGDGEELTKEMRKLLSDPSRKEKIGESAYNALLKNQGALEKTFNEIKNLYLDKT